MTDREEALIILQNCLDYENGEKCIYPIFPIERYREALKTAIEALKEQRPHGEWIPCSERLPEKFGIYIVTNENGVVFEHNYNDATMHGGTWWSYCERKIVAWMPLPEPYKREGDENG